MSELERCEEVARRHFRRVTRLNGERLALNNADNYEYFFEDAVRAMSGVSVDDLRSVDNIRFDPISSCIREQKPNELVVQSFTVKEIKKEVVKHLKLVETLCSYVVTRRMNGIQDNPQKHASGWSEDRNKCACRLFDKIFFDAKDEIAKLQEELEGQTQSHQGNVQKQLLQECHKQQVQRERLATELLQVCRLITEDSTLDGLLTPAVQQLLTKQKETEEEKTQDVRYAVE